MFVRAVQPMRVRTVHNNTQTAGENCQRPQLVATGSTTGSTVPRHQIRAPSDCIGHKLGFACSHGRACDGAVSQHSTALRIAMHRGRRWCRYQTAVIMPPHSAFDMCYAGAHAMRCACVLCSHFCMVSGRVRARRMHSFNRTLGGRRSATNLASQRSVRS